MPVRQTSIPVMKRRRWWSNLPVVWNWHLPRSPVLRSLNGKYPRSGFGVQYRWIIKTNQPNETRFAWYVTRLIDSLAKVSRSLLWFKAFPRQEKVLRTLADFQDNSRLSLLSNPPRICVSALVFFAPLMVKYKLMFTLDPKNSLNDSMYPLPKIVKPRFCLRMERVLVWVRKFREVNREENVLNH